MRLIKPVGFLDMLQLVANARMALTDSGGVQKEAYFLGTPCVTLREETEWVETVNVGANILTGLDRQKIIDAVARWKKATSHGRRAQFGNGGEAPFGRGDAAGRVVAELVRFLGRK
jgi:UDP-N-acetylglucosamine 2-epimerase